jgi:uncharacterized protein (DUF1501 family)
LHGRECRNQHEAPDIFTQIGGFDTHSAQLTGQGSLLTQVSQAINASFGDYD